MPFNEILSDRIREALINEKDVTEKVMFGGICFMVDGKMCMGVLKDEIMCRVDPELIEELLDMHGCRQMDMKGTPMKGFVLVSEDGFRNQKEFDYWVKLCLDFNPFAIASKKKQV